MGYILYNRDGSGGMAVEAALALAGAPFELITLASAPNTPLPESFRKTNPWRQVPVLVLPDGSTMTESAAMLVHLAACFPEKALAPAPGTPMHAQFLRWLVFMSANLYEAVLREGYPDRYTSDPNGAPGVQKAARQWLDRGFAVLEHELEGQPFLVGERMTLVDLYLAMLFSWYGRSEHYPHIYRLSTSVAADPVVAPIWERHGA